MLKKEKCLKETKELRIKNGLDISDENLIAVIHLKNRHGLDLHAAQDQSSKGSNDHGIDAWYYSEPKQELIIYQSKLSESRSTALRGFEDLYQACLWLEPIFIEGKLDVVPSDNPCLFNLFTFLGKKRDEVKKISFVLISLFDQNDLEDTQEYRDLEKNIIKSKLGPVIKSRPNGKLNISAEEYDLDKTTPDKITTYEINKIPNARVDLRNEKAYLDLSYIHLKSLVELYRRRGSLLFDKNVRLSITKTKEAKERLVNPMENTLLLITSGKLNPNIFPFYHIGVTIAATTSTAENETIINLESPSIINGCQTITIASEYLDKLETREDQKSIELFNQIKVIAKVVVGTTDDELKEITNSNNRQNPIENWQLFSNDKIHIEIEESLKEIGIFYERQKGKFGSVMKIADNAKYYNNTNGTFVNVEELGKIIALSRRNIQWAAKPGEIFLKKENHEKIFDISIPKYNRDIIFTTNLMKAMQRGIKNYLEMPAHANSNAPLIFQKQVVRHNAYYLVLLYFYQMEKLRDIRKDYSVTLNKIANPKLVEETQSVYQKIITKIKTWYTAESKDMFVDVNKRKLDEYFKNLAKELGVEIEGGLAPYTENSIDWNEYER